MSVFATSPHLAQPESPQDSRAHWITPEEQLHRLALPIAKVLVFENRDKFKDLYDVLDSIIIECAVRSILRRSDLSDNESEKPFPSLMDRAVEHLLDPSPLPPYLTTWYTALKRIDKLPEKIPPLPLHIQHILEGKCPEQICSEKKPDGTSYEIKDKCTLILIPEELGTADECEKIIKDYGKKHYPEGENPFRSLCILPPLFNQLGKINFGPTRWILHTNGVLAESRNKTWDQQAAMVAVLAEKTFVNWQVPKSFYEPLLTTCFKEIATEKGFYQDGNEENRYISTYSRINQTVQGIPLTVNIPSAYVVRDDDVFFPEHLGVAARREFLGT